MLAVQMQMVSEEMVSDLRLIDGRSASIPPIQLKSEACKWANSP